MKRCMSIIGILVALSWVPFSSAMSQTIAQKMQMGGAACGRDQRCRCAFEAGGQWDPQGGWILYDRPGLFQVYDACMRRNGALGPSTDAQVTRLTQTASNSSCSGWKDICYQRGGTSICESKFKVCLSNACWKEDALFGGANHCRLAKN